MKKICLLCCMVIVQLWNVYGQEETGLYNFFYYGSKDGLPQEDIMSIFQDKDGYIWFGTQSGVARYNGRTPKVYSTANGVIHNTIMDIGQDANGIIYFATPNGISILEKDSLHTVFQGTLFNFIFIDQTDNKWFYGEKEIGLLTADGQYINVDTRLEKTFRQVYSIVQHPDSSSVYIATEQGLYYLTENFDCIEILPSVEIVSLYIDKNSFLWVALDDQLYRVPLDRVRPGMDLQENEHYPYIRHRIKKITQAADASIWGIASGFAFQINSFGHPPEIYNRENGLTGYTLYSLMCDYENNTWIGLSGGAQKLNNKSVRKIAPTEFDGYITALFEDKKERIWFAAEDDVCYISNGKIVRYSKQMFPSPSEYQSITTTMLSNGNILIVHPLYLSIVDANTLLPVHTKYFKNPVEYVECVFVSSKGEIFIADSYNGVLYYMHSHIAEPVKFETDVTAGVYLFAEYKGQVIAPNHTGLCVFNGNSFEQKLTLDCSTWCVYIAGDSLWVGTENGLGLYQADTLNYIANNTVNSICRGMDDKHLWVGRNDGAYYINLDTGQPEISITNKTGLPHNEIAIGALILDSDSLLWLGTYHGLATFNFRKQPQYFIEPRNALIITQNDIVVPQLDPEKLRAFDHSIQFEMAALSFTNESDNIYEYSLKGSPKDSLPVVGKDFTAQYNNLPPGNYTFTFRTKGGSDIWSNYTNVGFSVSKPFWMLWWFYLLCLLILFVVVYLLIKGYVGILKQRNKALEKTVSERTALIQKKNDEISEQNVVLQEVREEIEAQNEELTAQNEELYETYTALQELNTELQLYKNNLEKMVEQKTAELLSAKEKAEESDKLKSAFLANMSHEIRTPMNGIIGFLNLIKQENLTREKLIEYIKIIDSNSQRLLKLIDDILDISKLEVGQLKIVKTEFQLNDLMDELNVFYNETILRSPKKKLTLVLDDSGSIPGLRIYTDPYRVKQILSNLIDNAIKFTEYGYIRYGYRLDENNILFSVEDTGSGMDEKQLNIIFERFRQANENIAQKYGGTGLGLAISKNLVHLMGGEMWATSQLGEGSTFFFTIPYEQSGN